jgi:hypothetical protein
MIWKPLDSGRWQAHALAALTGDWILWALPAQLEIQKTVSYTVHVIGVLLCPVVGTSTNMILIRSSSQMIHCQVG